MPTARELLEQAEALMRRDRMAALAADEDFPLLTDAVPEPAVESAEEPAVEAAENGAAVAAVSEDTSAPAESATVVVVETAFMSAAVTPLALAETPTPIVVTAPLPEPEPAPEPAVARLVSEHIEVTQDQQGEPSIWVVPTENAATITETGPDSLSPLTAEQASASRAPLNDGDALWRDEVAEIAAQIAESATPAEPSTDATLVDRGEDIAAPIEDFPLDATLDATRWNLMAEDIRMQVLQRIDIFTDAGLRDQLNARLQPVVERASADLVAAINQHVGQILREYVAEAIEREIEKWRQEPR